jgi:hypothetical protein
LTKNNAIKSKSGEVKFSRENIKEAYSAISNIPFDSLLSNNERIYDLLTLGKSLRAEYRWLQVAVIRCNLSTGKNRIKISFMSLMNTRSRRDIRTKPDDPT